MKEKRIMNEKIVKPKGKVLSYFLIILETISCGFLIYNLLKLSYAGGVVAKYIYLGIVISITIYLIIVFFAMKKLDKQKKLRRNIKKSSNYTSIVLYIIISTIISIVIMYIYNYIGSFNKEYITYSSSLITMVDKDIDEIDDIVDYKIGLLTDKKSIEGYIIPNDVLKEKSLKDENKILYYDSYQELMSDLYSNKLDAIFITSDYVSVFDVIDSYENINEETKVIYTKSKKLKKSTVSEKETSSYKKSIKEPFTLLLMGVDSPDEGLNKNTVAHGDTLILITFNPKTLNATMLTIPRDSYVPIACWKDKAENKITHAAMYGNDCMMNTIENYFGVNIDYYAKINFKGMVGLVNAIGGIDVEVPKDLCTDNSNREKEVCISKGWQHLDGEGALVLTRNRKQLAGGDMARGENQQLVVKAILNKLKTIKSATKFLNIIDTISNNFDTNFTTDQILSFYSIVESLMNTDLVSNQDLINIDKLYLQGTGQMIYDERAKMVLWNYIPNKESKNDIIKAMKINLGKLDYEENKEFNFSINEDYEKEVVGYGPYQKDYKYDLLPSFIGYSKEYASTLADKLGIKVVFKGEKGTVIKQSEPVSKRIDKMTGALTLTLSGTSNNTSTKTTTETKNSNSKDNKKTSN